MRIQLLYFPALSVIFFHNTSVLASSLTLRGKDKPDEWKPLVKLNIENEKNLRNQVYSHTNAKVGRPVTSGWLEDELVSATTVYLKDLSSEPSQTVQDEILYREVKKKLQAQVSSSSRRDTVSDEEIMRLVDNFNHGSFKRTTKIAWTNPCYLNLAIDAAALGVSLVGLRGGVDDFARDVFDIMPSNQRDDVIRYLEEIGKAVGETKDLIAQKSVDIIQLFLENVTVQALKEWFTNLSWWDYIMFGASILSIVASAGTGFIINVGILINDSLTFITNIIKCVDELVTSILEPEIACPPKGCSRCTAAEENKVVRSGAEPWFFDEDGECCRGDENDQSMCTRIFSATNECDIILTEVNANIAEKGFRHGHGAYVDILEFDVPVSGHLTRIEVNTLAHDQNKFGRCSRIKMIYYSPPEFRGETFSSPLVPRSGTYKEFSWDQVTNYAVERGGVLKLAGTSCHGGGIHTKNTVAQIDIRKDNCIPSNPIPNPNLPFDPFPNPCPPGHLCPNDPRNPWWRITNP